MAETVQLGMAFVGKDYRTSRNRGVTSLVSKDGLRIFVYPTNKNSINPVDGLPWSKTGFVANFETKKAGTKQAFSNVHVDVKR